MSNPTCCDLHRMVTKDDVDAVVSEARGEVVLSRKGPVIVHLADFEARTLRAQLAEAVALLERSPMLYRCIAGSMGQDFCDSRDGVICSDHARRVFLAKLRGAL